VGFKGQRAIRRQHWGPAAIRGSDTPAYRQTIPEKTATLTRGLLNGENDADISLYTDRGPGDTAYGLAYVHWQSDLGAI
jgi:hypothetical protein